MHIYAINKYFSAYYIVTIEIINYICVTIFLNNRLI